MTRFRFQVCNVEPSSEEPVRRCLFIASSVAAQVHLTTIRRLPPPQRSVRVDGDETALLVRQSDNV